MDIPAAITTARELLGDAIFYGVPDAVVAGAMTPLFTKREVDTIEALEGMCEMSGHGVECGSWRQFDGMMIRHSKRPCNCPKAAAETILEDFTAQMQELS